MNALAVEPDLFGLNFSALLTNIIHLILPGYGIKTVLNTFTQQIFIEPGVKAGHVIYDSQARRF